MMHIRKRPEQDPNDAEDNYVDKKEFYQEMVEWKNRCKVAERNGEERPPMPECIGEKIMLIAEGVSRAKNFSGYTYKDEAVADGIEQCVRYGHNFDTDNYTNPFAYFTRFIYNAFYRRISIEKKEAAKRKKCIEMAIDDPRYKHDLGDAGTSAVALAEMQKKLAAETDAYDANIESKKKIKKTNSRMTSSSSSAVSLF